MVNTHGMASKQEELLSSKQVATELGCSYVTVARLARTGKLRPAVEGEGIRGARFFRRAVVERYKRQRSRD